MFPVHTAFDDVGNLVGRLGVSVTRQVERAEQTQRIQSDFVHELSPVCQLAQMSQTSVII